MVLLTRIAWLFGLSLAPMIVTPEPSRSSDALLALLGALILVAPAAYAGWLAKTYGAFEAKVATGLFLLADAVLAWKASATLSAGAPLMSGYYLAAPAVWTALAALVATLAGQYLGTSFKNKRMGGAIATLAIGIFVFRDAHDLVASPELQWRSVLRTDPSNARALEALPSAYFRSPEGRGRIEACLIVDAASCFCRLTLAENALAADQAQAANAEAEQAACEGTPRQDQQRELVALSRALTQKTAEADALVASERERRPNAPRLLYAGALVASQRGDLDAAIDLAGRALEADGALSGSTLRGAKLLLAASQLAKGDREHAKTVLLELQKANGDDAEVVYDLALIADQEGDFNAARQGYLKALNLRPTMRSARYNLALLTLRFGAADEARHHAQRFVESFPDDPRGAALLARIGN